MAAVSGQRLASLTIETLQKMRSDRDFDLFYELIVKKASNISGIGKPELPRKRNKPNYSILQYVGDRRVSANNANAYYPTTAHQHFKVIYLEAIDSIISAIKDRFEQPSFAIFSDVEQLLLKSIKGDDYRQELANFSKVFKGDIDQSALPVELAIFGTICKDKDPTHFDEIVSILKEVSKEERLLMKNVTTMVLINGATTGTAERSFSMARRIKNWMRSTMSQKRLNSLAILNSNKSHVDRLSLISIANDFVKSRPNRRVEFGMFTEDDLKQ